MTIMEGIKQSCNWFTVPTIDQTDKTGTYGVTVVTLRAQKNPNRNENE